MFGQNEIVGKGYFKDAKDENLLVTSMFMTLQGEGPYRGQPAFFIRLAKCNLACSFCDTYFDSGDWMTFNEIEAKIEDTIDKFYHSRNKDRPEWTNHFDWMETHKEEKRYDKKKMVLVITGGEPSLQKNLAPFLDKMKNVFQNTQIESNGILTLDLPKETTVVVSPKCSEKNGQAVKYLTPSFNMLEQAACLKFVMEATPGSPYSDIPDWAHSWAKRTGKQVYISPMNIYNKAPEKAKTDRLSNKTTMDDRSTIEEVISFWTPGLLNMKANQDNHEYVGNFCVQHGYIMNLQIHLFASLA